jgi:hypothetical protein
MEPEPNSSRRRNRVIWQVIGSLLISIACGLAYPLVGGGRTSWLGLGILASRCLLPLLSRSRDSLGTPGGASAGGAPLR